VRLGWLERAGRACACTRTRGSQQAERARGVQLRVSGRTMTRGTLPPSAVPCMAQDFWVRAGLLSISQGPICDCACAGCTPALPQAITDRSQQGPFRRPSAQRGAGHWKPGSATHPRRCRQRPGLPSLQLAPPLCAPPRAPWGGTAGALLVRGA